MTRCFPFDSVVTGQNEYGLPQGDRDYNSSDMRKYISSFLTTGIKNGDTNLKVSASDGLNIKVQEGTAIIEGAFFELYDEPENLKVSANKKSRIIVRLDLNEDVRKVYLTALEGDNINPPELTRNSVIYEISLAQVETDENTITNIIDERADVNLCGYINSLIKVDVTGLLSKIETELANIEDGSLIALKNGFLQKNLNAEKIKNKSIDDLVPLGTIRLFPNKNLDNDEHYLICDGSVLESEDYPDLNSILPSTVGKIVEEQDINSKFKISCDTSDSFMSVYDEYLFFLGKPTSESGSKLHRFYYTKDFGNTITELTPPSSNHYIRGIIKYNNVFIAFCSEYQGDYTYIYTSKDLKSWELQFQSQKYEEFGSYEILNFNNELLVIRVSTSHGFYSFDGFSWKELSYLPNCNSCKCIYFKNNLYFYRYKSESDSNIICGYLAENGKFSESAVAFDVKLDNSSIKKSCSPDFILNVNNEYLVLFYPGNIYRSDDGKTFTEISQDTFPEFSRIFRDTKGKIYALSKNENSFYEYSNDKFNLIFKDFSMTEEYKKSLLSGYAPFFTYSDYAKKYIYSDYMHSSPFRITSTDKLYIPQIIDEENSLYGYIKVLKEGDE